MKGNPLFKLSKSLVCFNLLLKCILHLKLSMAPILVRLPTLVTFHTHPIQIHILDPSAPTSPSFLAPSLPTPFYPSTPSFYHPPHLSFSLSFNHYFLLPSLSSPPSYSVHNFKDNRKIFLFCFPYRAALYCQYVEDREIKKIRELETGNES